MIEEYKVHNCVGDQVEGDFFVKQFEENDLQTSIEAIGQHETVET